MEILPKKIMHTSSSVGTLYHSYDKISDRMVLSKILDKCPIKDISLKADSGLIEISVDKEKLKSFIGYADKVRQQEEYKQKCLELESEFSLALGYVLTREITVDPEILVKYLPEKSLIDADYAMWKRSLELSCGYYALSEGMYSIELAKKLALGETLDDIDEELKYHYYVYPHQEPFEDKAAFTKSEFIKSVADRKEQIIKKL